MAYTAFLCHQAYVQAAKPSTDWTGQQLVSFEDKEAPQACRLIPTAGSERRDVAGESELVEDFVLHFLPTADINEKDKVSQVLDQSGNVLATNIDIQFIKRCFQGRVLHHLEARGRSYR